MKSKQMAAVAVASVAGIVLAGSGAAQSSTAAPPQPTAFSGTIKGGPGATDGTFYLSVNAIKDGSKLKPTKVKFADLGRIYIYCDGEYVSSPVLNVRGSEVKRKKFAVTRHVTELGQQYDVKLQGAFKGPKLKRAAGTARVTLSAGCGNSGKLRWSARYRPG